MLETRNPNYNHQAAKRMLKNLTKQVVFGQGVQHPGGSNKVTHCCRQGRGVNANCDHGWQYINVPQEAVVSLEKITRRNWENMTCETSCKV